MAPLAWPADFPPRDGWKRFFLGVRWLGPDLSFFGELRALQGSRTAEGFAAAWPQEDRPAASFLGELLQRHIGWPTPYFLPEDSFAAIAYGPRFRSLDDLLFETFADALDDAIGAKIPDDVWERLGTGTFGEVVAAVRPYLGMGRTHAFHG